MAMSPSPMTSTTIFDFGGFNNFMHSYGLKPWDHDDIQEGKAIIQGFRDQDRYEWAQAQKEQSK